MRYAKAIGLALIAALALTAFGASAAQAESAGKFWADTNEGKIDATSEGDQLFTLPGKPSLTCKHVQGDAAYTGESTTLTGKNVDYTDPSFTKEGEKEFCHVVAFGITLPVKVDENGCHFTFEAGTYNAGTDSSAGGVKIEGCTENESITIEVWNASHSSVACIFHIPEQTISNINYSNIEVGGKDAVTVEAANAAVKTTVTEGGALCSSHETTNAAYDGDIIARATDNDEEYVDARVTG